MSLSRILIISMSLVLFACKKNEDKVGVPKLSWVNYGPDVIKANSDSVYFELSYEDEDGDLGENDPAASNLFLTDERIPLTYKFRISELTPNQMELHIKGSLRLSLPNTVSVKGSGPESVQYSLYVVDRAGHKSNILTTNSLQVIP